MTTATCREIIDAMLKTTTMQKNESNKVTVSIEALASSAVGYEIRIANEHNDHIDRIISLRDALEAVSEAELREIDAKVLTSKIRRSSNNILSVMLYGSMETIDFHFFYALWVRFFVAEAQPYIRNSLIYMYNYYFG
jgi:hypothetical protein